MSTFVFDAYGTLYDVNSVATATEEAFPGYGDTITQVWRLKQLEYTWLRSLMGRYEDFSTVTRESLLYTLKTLGLQAEPETVDAILDRYLHLSLYSDALEALEGLREAGHQVTILSNGSQEMLDALVRNSGLDTLLDAVISIDEKRIYKPSPEAYSLVGEKLGVSADDVVFVSCNPFDVCGAKSYGFKLAWIERVPAMSLQAEIRDGQSLEPSTMFKVLRMRMDELGYEPDVRIHTLLDLIGLETDA